jgi:HEAT repeat protein
MASNDLSPPAASPFPWKVAVIAGLVVGVVMFSGSLKRRGARSRPASEGVDGPADPERAQEDFVGRAERSLKLLRSGASGMAVCEAAIEAGHLGLREAIPYLQARLRDTADAGLQGCAASGLVTLGEIDEPLAFYVASAQGSNDELRRGAIVGFGGIGPRAAADALPFLTAEAQSKSVTHRLLAVQALSRMGPGGVRPLRDALNDKEPLVSNKAAAGLAEMGER